MIHKMDFSSLKTLTTFHCAAPAHPNDVARASEKTSGLNGRPLQTYTFAVVVVVAGGGGVLLSLAFC